MNWKIFRSVLPLVALIAFAYYTQSLKVDYSSEVPVLSTEAYDLVWQFQMNEGSELLRDALKHKVELDEDTARRIFTLLYVFQMRG